MVQAHGLSDRFPPTLAPVASRVMARATAMGLVEPLDGEAFDEAYLDRALKALVAAGIARRAGLGRASLAEVDDGLAGSPHPATEWSAVIGVLGDELTARLVGVSGSSLRRYAAGTRETPDPIAHRLHALALVIADLLGSYNDYGVRRWFERPRRPLGGQAPVDLLTGDWDPDDDGPRQVAELARSLTGLGAA